MKLAKIVFAVLPLTILITACGQVDRERTGIQRCEPKPGYENDYPAFEYDATDESTTFVSGGVNIITSMTFRDRISGKMMTVDQSLYPYYDCNKLDE